MPTEEQLDILFESEQEFKPNQLPQLPLPPFKGELLGEISYDDKTKRILFFPKKDSED